MTSWKVGDRVTASSGECGTCAACRSGRPSICRVRRPDDGQGGWSQYMRMRESSLVALPDGLDLRAAALAEPFAVALHAVSRSTAEPGARVLVTGAGPIGTLTVVALHARGIDDVTVSEPNPLRRAIAERARREDRIARGSCRCAQGEVLSGSTQSSRRPETPKR